MAKRKKQEEVDDGMHVSNAKFMEVPIEQVETNPWNPNEMDEATFNMLVDNLVGAGMNQTVLLTPVRDGDGNPVEQSVSNYRWGAEIPSSQND